MSRIRSQLDSILGSQATDHQPVNQAPNVQAPRPAYPQQNNAAAYTPAPAHPAHEPTAPVQPVSAAVPPAQAAPASYASQPTNSRAAELDALHKSLEQLSRKIASMPRPDVVAQHQSRQQSDAAILNAQNEAMGNVVTELRSGFTGMRQELNQTAQSIHSGISNTLAQDLQRISDGVAALQNDQNLHPEYVDQMQSELSNLNAGIGQLLEKPVSQVDLTGVTQAIETNYSDLVSRLDLALTQRGNEMPVVDIPDYSTQFTTINDRLEEMTRAVVSLTVNPDNTAENHAFERIEARLASLSKTVDELGENAIAGQTAVANAGLETETIAAQIAKLSEKLDNLDGMGAASEALGQEIFPGITELANRIDTLQSDVGQIASNIDKAAKQAPEQIVPATPDFSVIEQHFADLAAKMDALASGSTENPDASGQEVLSVLRELVGRVEGLEQIAASAADEVPAPVMDSPVSDERFNSLEANLAHIAGQLGSLPAAAPVVETNFGPITERLDNIEGQIAASRDIVIDIATEAAQRAVAGGGEDTSQALAAMMEEIRAIRAEQHDAPAPVMGQSDPQLAEIGSTMAAIADRLSQIEANSAQQADALSQQQVRSSAQYAEQQAQAAAYAEPVFEAAPVQTNAAQMEPDFDLTGENQSVEPIQTIADAPSIDPSMDLAEDADFALAQGAADAGLSPEMQSAEVGEDIPLEPGSGMPDLETLVQRATRKKKAQAGEADEGDEKPDDGLSDLMAAARRAAQAASVEAESVRDVAPKKNKIGLSIGKKLPGASKPSLPGKKTLLMSAAAIAVVAGGLFVSQNIFGGNDDAQQMAAADNAVGSEEQLDNTNLAQEDAGDLSEGGEPRVVDMADSSPLLSPESDGSEPQVLSDEQSAVSDASMLNTDNMNDSSTGDGTPVQSASLPAAGEMPSEELGNLAFRQAVASGNGDALFEAGRRFTEGQIVPRDLKEAVKWYTRAAEAGHAPAQYRLGNFFEKGHGVEANPKQAVQWYNKAAAQGNALAMHNLAVLNAMGVVSGDADMPTAVSWFEKAADLGVKDSQVNLGILFTKGMGVQEDLERAYKWFAIAAKGGDTDAAKKRDTVAQAMRPEQLEKARGEAEIWKPGKLDPAANVARVSDDWKPAIDATKLTKAQMVKLAQELLTKAGFDAGPADGMMGNKTRNAIAAFQEANGLPVDGAVSQDLMQALAEKINI